MSVFKTLLKPQKNPLHFSLKSLPISSRFYSTTTSTTTPSSPQENKKPIDVIFKEAVGLCKKAEGNCEGENTNKLKSRLRELEREVIELRANSNVKRKELKKSKSLYAVFTNQPGYGERSVERTREQVPEVYNELSPDMELFVNHLYKEGYFNNANFLRGNKLEFGCFQSRYGRDFIKFAAEKFSLDHQEIAKWLSGSDLKKVALFGCPSLTKKNVFAAKRLRKFFEIQENTVCGKCVLKQSCKFVNQSVWKGDTKNLNLVVVMRVIILYALELVRPELGMPNEIQVSVSRLLKEVLKLSQTLS
ncbi:uncharacterized protein LOC112008388 [Quercus suber]|nr:uncharacterized protein LOC112008388 [Quercus suber]XP_023896489.1 uncharacterized protein LOC112008388 [Quercus suber]XP_023896490.1 uncharacterized protein LOC112008388 [Quercus suber]POE55879.1 hypothetical protein CFP56_66000 [Quercus suber]